jgi:hypothetical protein
MPVRTVSESIAITLEKEKKPLSAKEITEIIIAMNLYNFNTKNPINIVQNTLRKKSSLFKSVEIERSKKFLLNTSAAPGKHS